MVDGMSELRWEIIKHSDITDSLLTEIALLKDQHWIHGIRSQLIWINNNIRNIDYHLCGFINQKLAAYMALVEVSAEINSKRFGCLGLSNVCVSNEYEKKGYGSELVQQANRFISDQNRIGLLLCKESLVSFYQKNSWFLLEYEKATVKGEIYAKEIMVYSSNIVETVYSIQIERNF